MAGGCRKLGAVLWKNVKLKQRAWFSTLVEIVAPIVIVAIFIALKDLTSRKTIPAQNYAAAKWDLAQWASYNPESLRNDNPNEPIFAPVVAGGYSRIYDGVHMNFLYDIANREGRKIAFVDAGNKGVGGVKSFFWTFLAKLHPDGPSLLMGRDFADDADLQSYISAEGYGFGDTPPIHAAITVYDDGPNYDFAIRLNASRAGGVKSDIYLDGTPGLAFDQDTYPQGGFLDIQNILQAYVRWRQTTIDYSALSVPVSAEGAAWRSKLFNLEYVAMREYFSPMLDPYIPMSVREVAMPTPEYIKDEFLDGAAQFLGLLFTLVFMWPVSRLVKAIMEEKEYRVKESMKMFGVTDWVLYSSWYLTYGVLYVGVAVVVALLCLEIFPMTNFVFTLVLFGFFSLGVVSFCLLVQCFFSSAKIAAAVSSLIFLILYFPYFSTSGSTASAGAKTLSCLCLPACLAEGLEIVAAWEKNGLGVQESTAGRTVYSFAFTDVIGMIFFDIVLYLVVALYFDKVVKSTWGVSWPWYFPCTCLCCPCRRRKPKEGGKRPDLPDTFEPPSASWEPRKHVELLGLRREFGSGKKKFTAVDNSWLDMYEGQILALLGHNGAGKTTTIGMMTGMTEVSAGDAKIYGKSITSEMAQIRESIGVCPQHDILFMTLTVREHLQFFAMVKGVPAKTRKQEIQTMIEKVGLKEKADYRAGGLSGGQKRKLSVAIALLGGSKVVFLDEPSTGMDPFSRRAIWDLLREEKKNRVIILTTHFMEEADYLGDRIAIMAGGKVKCCGSSLFLKSKYGVGYTFTCSKSVQGMEDKTQEVIKRFVPQAELLASVAAEISFRLPFSATDGLPDLLELLEKEGPTHGVRSFALSVTTLEEVFLKVGAHEDNGDVGQIRERSDSHAILRSTSKDQLGMETPGIELQARRMSSKNALEIIEKAQSELLDDVPPPQEAVPFAPSRGGGSPPGGAGAGAVQPSHDEPIAPVTPKPSLPVEEAPVFMTPTATGAAAAFPSDVGEVQDQTLAPVQQGVVPTSVPVDGGESPGFSKAIDAANALNAKEAAQYNGNINRSMFFSHVSAMIYKKMNVSKRDRKGLVCQVVLPTLFFLVALMFLAFSPSSFTNYSRDYLTTNQQADWSLPQKMALAAPEATTVSWAAGELFAEVNRLTGSNVMPETVLTYTNDSGSFPVNNSEIFGEWLFQQGLSSTTNNRFGAIFLKSYSTALDTAADTYPYISVDLFWNSTARDSFPVFQNELFNSWVRTLSNRKDTKLRIANFPLPPTAAEEAFANIFTAIFLGFGFAFVPAFWGLAVVREREFKSKHLQMISGVSIPAYWVATWLWDMFFYLIPGAAAVIFLAAFGVDELVSSETIGATILLFLLYGMSIASFTYSIQFIFNNHTTAQNLLLIFYIMSGSFLMILSFILSILPSTREVHDDVLIYIFYLFPCFSLVKGMTNLVLLKQPLLWQGDYPDVWEMRVIGYALTYMAAEAVLFFLVTLGIEYFIATPALYGFVENGTCSGNKKALMQVDPELGDDRDSDVLAEEKRLKASAGDGSDLVQVLGLKKVYPTKPPKVAVKGVWFGIPEGQCFGYLGVNGAGKTTTLKMLTGDVLPSGGTAKLGGRDVLKEQNAVRQLMGYCPQFDALIMELSAREHLNLFARIKGVAPSKIPKYVDELIDSLGLQEYADRACGTYSGGNKRKLSLGLSLVGNPAIVFLDEPTSGVDPASRRFMWSLINTTMEGRSVILTTHSMEECEALCSKIAIMVAGELMCMGTAAHLRSKFGNAFQLEVTVKDPESDASSPSSSPKTAEQTEKALTDWTLSKYKGTEVLEAHGSHFTFKIPKESSTLANIFRDLNASKKELCIADYAVSETTLEQVFIYFAEKGAAPEE
uniref:ABC transporter domain-containing protein n=1 Tax=Chromera velia CCMP2878 TaxID=1169474 RepID=A0A0G4HPX1_9ALVE|eukprot:Cvel_1241.t1-p1 / transcript=Cvel_1241.t1 / gene=Cvel_1241 / organism=Chromera_velia_CCMP2878 / gene_product=ABC transporter A family member 1, putative / transcript_product=ABC transporter A family member 1, putative / location=Cvel_scaffold41:109069-123717(+) / protein_length=1875 / sequence_SO=supercontig / SO=protein_coding / is_pseudo=false